MGTTLTGTTPANTRQSLLKTTDNTALSTTVKAISDGNGNDTPLKLATDKVEIGNVDYNEIQYLNGVTSAIQDQLNGKQASLGFTAENVANKSTSVVTDQASDTKYPSVKSVYDWAVGAFQTALGFTPENVANKSTSVVTDQASNTKYPSVKAVYDWVVGQLATKQNTITGAATTIDTEDLTASRALVSDASGKVAVSDVTATELGYVSGVTSAVQTQINSKISTYDGATYDVTALAAVSQAEYDAIGTKSATTLYFII